MRSANSNVLIVSKQLAPSFEEMKNALGLASKSGVHRLIHSLAEQGYIYRGKKGHARRVQLADSNLAGIPTEVLAAEIERRSVGSLEAAE